MPVSRASPAHALVRTALSVVLLAALAAPAAAQGGAPDAPAVLPRVRFRFSGARLRSADRRFRWIGRIGFDADVVDYRRGRLTLRLDYEATIGRERRRFDLNQGTYFLELGASRRAGPVEVWALAQHVSRHLVDRENPPAISWNAIATRVSWRRGGFSTSAEVGRVWDAAFVDYRWTGLARAAFEHPVGGPIGFVAGEGHFVDGVAPERSKGSGVDVEAGVRLPGATADLEAFVAYVRRLDAFPTERGRVRWVALGLRIVTH